MPKSKVKNLCGKMKSVHEPYEIWKDERNGWEWRVLKKYQVPENEAKNKYARWYCAVKSPFTFGSWEYGDCYIKDIENNAFKVEV